MIDEVEPGADRSTDASAPAEGSLAPEFDVDAGPVQERLTEAQLEALLFVAERPLTRREIAAVAGVDRATVDARLGDLEIALADRGIRLILSGERVELVTAPDAGALIARYVGADAVRLSPASMETLAIVAYRQPVTKAAVERIRGVDSDYTIRTLLHRRLIVELGRSEAPGRPFLYGTGFDFLERFGLTSLDELPPLDVELAARLVDEEAVADVDATSGVDGASGANGRNGTNGTGHPNGMRHAKGTGHEAAAEPGPGPEPGPGAEPGPGPEPERDAP